MSKDITFASFNLYNLELPGRVWRFSNEYSQAQYDAKIAWTADMIRRLDADVIAFQELWSPQCLTAAFEAAGLRDDYTLVTIKDTLDEDWYDIAVAAAVRKPWVVQEKRLHKAFPEGYRLIKRGRSASDPVTGATVTDPEDDEIEVTIRKFSRTVLDLELGQPGSGLPPIRTLCAHLKSKMSTQLDKAEREDPLIAPNGQALGEAISTLRRTAEAAALRIIVTDIIKGDDSTGLVLVGDLNDGPGSNTVNILTGQPSYTMYEEHQAGRRSDAGLYSAGRMQQYRQLRDVGFTHEHNHVKDVLDHILVSEQFYDHSRSKNWSFQELRVWNDHIGPKASRH